MSSYAKRHALQFVTFFVYYVGFCMLFVGTGLIRDAFIFLPIFLLGQLWTMIDRKFDSWKEKALEDGSR
jgi:hypothetical protein